MCLRRIYFFLENTLSTSKTDQSLTWRIIYINNFAIDNQQNKIQLWQTINL